VLRTALLSYQWTFGAWEAAGGGILTEKLFGFRLHPDAQRGIPMRWARMAGGIMFGVPFLLQLAIRAGGAKWADDDDEWWIWNNEPGRRTSFNLNPMLKAMAAAPGVPWAKDNIPLLGGFVPGAIGSDPTFGNRKTYMHFGKQGWEITSWFADIMGTAYSKSNLPLQRMWVALAGSAPNSKYDEPFKGRNFMDSLLERTGYVLEGFKPMSYSTMGRTTDAGFLTMLGPITKGISATGSTEALRDLFRAYSKPSYYDKMRQSAHYWNDLPSLAVEHLRAAEVNGHAPDLIMLDAMKPILTELYREVYQSLPNRPTGKVKEKKLGTALASLHRLNFVYGRLLKSIESRDQRNEGKINLTEDVLKQRDYATREAFWYPDGRYNRKKKLPQESSYTPTQTLILGSESGNAITDYMNRLAEGVD